MLRGEQDPVSQVTDRQAGGEVPGWAYAIIKPLLRLSKALAKVEKF